MNTLISTFHFRLHNSTAHLSNVLKLLEVLIPSETYYVENMKSTNSILGTNTKSTNLRIHELIIFNQITKIDTHEEKYFHSTHMCIQRNKILTCVFKETRYLHVHLKKQDTHMCISRNKILTCVFKETRYSHVYLKKQDTHMCI